MTSLLPAKAKFTTWTLIASHLLEASQGLCSCISPLSPMQHQVYPPQCASTPAHYFIQWYGPPERAHQLLQWPSHFTLLIAKLSKECSYFHAHYFHFLTPNAFLDLLHFTPWHSTYIILTLVMVTNHIWILKPNGPFPILIFFGFSASSDTDLPSHNIFCTWLPGLSTPGFHLTSLSNT